MSQTDTPTDTATDGPLAPQLYLVTPPAFELDVFLPLLNRVMDAHPPACLRLALASRDEDMLARAADALREATHPRDIALVIDHHVVLAERLGLDGVHLTDTRGLRKLRSAHGDDFIIGAHCGTSRHDGLNAAEAGADYVSFGPVGASALGAGARVELDVFQWWSDVVEVPVVAEGALTPDLIAQLAPISDFLALGDEIWRTDDPVAALDALWTPVAAMG